MARGRCSRRSGGSCGGAVAAGPSLAGRIVSHRPIVEAAPQLLEEEQPLQVRARLGLHVISELGRGGMGRVYLASDSKLGRTVALKALAPQLAREATSRASAPRGAAAAMLTHPGICTVYALEELDGELYIATEFVDGHTLRDEIEGRTSVRRETSSPAPRGSWRRRSRAPMPKASCIAISSPKTSCGRADGLIKILDFGLARMTSREADQRTLTSSMPGAVVGTPAYMAPEQINSDPIGPQTDVFAFGVLMYEWITGTHPFKAKTPWATFALILESKPESLQSDANARALWPLIERSLRKTASERFASGGELLRALEQTAETAASPSERGAEHNLVANTSAVDDALHRCWHVGVADQVAARSESGIAGALDLRADWSCLSGRRNHPGASDFHRRHEPATSAGGVEAHREDQILQRPRDCGVAHRRRLYLRDERASPGGPDVCAGQSGLRLPPF